MTILRPYQDDALSQIRDAFGAGRRSPLLVMPTGAGKTAVAAELIRDERGRVLVLAPRRELIHQVSRALDRLGISHGILLAGADDRRNLMARVQVASIDTLLARLIRRQRFELLPPDLIVIDEAHLSITKTRLALLALWPAARIVGLTATPTRKDGRALGKIFDALIEPTTVQQLTEAGYLVPARYFAPSTPDLERVRTVAGDYHQGQLDGVMNRPRLVGDIVAHWLEHAAGRRSVVFCTSISHSAAMAEAFLHAGIVAEHVDAHTPHALREECFARFSAGDTQVLCNVQLASYGFDLPQLSCVVQARPTKSVMQYLQMLGRGLRTAPGKSDCLVLDHAGNVLRHGFAAQERLWTLEGEYAIKPQPQRERERHEPKLVTCPECKAIYQLARVCPECGYFRKPRGRQVRTIDGQLIEIGDVLFMPTTELDKMQFFAELRGHAASRGYKLGWAWHQYQVKFKGEKPLPSWSELPPAVPSPATRGWIKSRQIAWRKSQQRAGGTC